MISATLSDAYTETSVKRMQSAMNRISRQKGWQILSLTGGVGPGTLGILKKLVDASIINVYGTAIQAEGQPYGTSTKPLLEANADLVAGWLTGYANKEGYPPETAASGTAVVSPATVTPKPGGGSATAYPVPAAPAPAPSGGSKWLYYLAAGAGGLAILALAYRLSSRTAHAH